MSEFQYLADPRQADFEQEFRRVLLDRRALRRYMPTPDCFPLFCEMVEQAKAFYVRLPREQRNSLRHVTFSYFGRNWSIRINFGAMRLENAVYIDICMGKSKSPLVTVAAKFGSALLEAIGDE